PGSGGAGGVVDEGGRRGRGDPRLARDVAQRGGRDAAVDVALEGCIQGERPPVHVSRRPPGQTGGCRAFPGFFRGTSSRGFPVHAPILIASSIKERTAPELASDGS